MILVTGAAGKSGKAVVTALAAKGAQVRAFIRNPEHAGALLALGAGEVSFGSFEDARALAQVAAGVEAIYHICPNVSRDEVAYARAVAAAARTHGVKRFVYHSVLHPQIEAMPHHWEKMRAEEMLFAAGFDLTVLQPTAHMQNILGVWDGIARDGVFRFPYPAATRLSLVDLADVGEAAAIALTQDGHSGATYELAGTPALGQTEVASALSAVLGRSVRAEEEPLAAWEARAGAGGMGEYERMTLAAMFRYYAEHGMIGSPNTLRWLLGRAPTSLASFLERERRRPES
jgi:NAD(P)H dehydrogenase (quinone)